MAGSENLLSSVKNSLKVLRSFSMEHPQKGVRELAKELEFSKSSVQKYLSTLASEGFVKKNIKTGKYELGTSVLELNSILLGHLDLHNEAQPLLKNLVQKLNETAHLAVIENQQVVYLCKEESSTPVQIFTHSGRCNPLHCTSSGKLLLAYSDSSILEKILENELTKFTPNTITDPEQLRKELKGIREKGYSVSLEELSMGIVTISAPVRDYSGQVVAAINLVGPRLRFTKQKIQYFASELKYSGELISEKLGYWKK